MATGFGTWSDIVASRSGSLAALLLLAAPLAAWAAMSPEERAAILAPTADFSKPESYEALPGGSATNRRRLDRDAFSQPSASLDFAERSDFFVGNGLFKRVWVTAPSSTQAADGLGPLYNARSCQSCHLKDGRGHPPESSDDSAVSMFLRLSVPPQNDADRALLASGEAAIIPEPTYGGQLQDLAVPGVAAEGRMNIDYEDVPVTLGDGTKIELRQPHYTVRDLGYGPLHPESLLSPRVAPPMIGLGLLEAVSADYILAAADPEDDDGDGISGRANQIWSDLHSETMLGRFGWKSGMPSIDEQSAGALAGDIGISNPLAPGPWGDCTDAQPTCLNAHHGTSPQYEDLEANREIMDLTVYYSRNLAVPARRDVGDAGVLEGKKLFYEIGCASCHSPKHATSNDYPVAGLGGQLIWPYSDLLLHDMGVGLADGRPEGLADGREWRTAPLRGIGLTETVNGHTYFLHDGRARNLTEAILWHGGETEASQEAFRSFGKAEREALLAFLNSL